MHSQSLTFCRWRSAVSLLGEIAVAEVSLVLLQTGSTEKWFLATNINAHLNQYLLICTLNLGFFYSFSLSPDSRLFWHYTAHCVTLKISCLAQTVARRLPK